MRNKRPELLQNIEEKIAKVTDIFSKSDKLALLWGLHRLQIRRQFDANDDGISEVGVEYGLSFAAASTVYSFKTPTNGIVNKLSGLLENIRHDYSLYVLTEHSLGKYSDLESALRYKTIMSTLYVRGSAYQQHIQEIYKELFSQHDSFFQEKYGFKSWDIH